MSMANYDEKRFNRISAASERTVSLVSEVSNSSDILNDSQDRIEDDDNDNVLIDSYRDFMQSHAK